MDNPWTMLPDSPPYVLLGDRERLLQYNAMMSASTKPENRLQLDLLPEPYLGDPRTARVLFLTLNPGHDPRDHDWHSKPVFREALRASLLHENRDWPVYLLDPRIEQSPGGTYWRKKLKALIKAVGVHSVAQNVAVLEWFPYHSSRFVWHSLLTSIAQPYTFGLVREALQDEARLVIVMRARRRRHVSVPELEGVASLNSPQNSAVTANNLPDGVFDRICRIVAR